MDYDLYISNFFSEHNIEDTPTNRAEYKEWLCTYSSLNEKGRKELINLAMQKLEEQNKENS